MKIPFKQIFTSAKSFIRANTPSIMIGAGIISMGAAVISAARATPLALDRLDEKADELDVMPCDLTRKESAILVKLEEKVEEFNNSQTFTSLNRAPRKYPLAKYIKHYWKGFIDYFIADEIAMVKSVPMNPKRADFFKDYQTMEFGAFINKWFPTTFKVRLNSFLRKTAFRLGIYNESKRFVKKILGKN